MNRALFRVLALALSASMAAGLPPAGPASARVAAHGAAQAPARVVSAEALFAQDSYTVRWTTSRPGAPVRIYVSVDPSASPAHMKLLLAGARQGEAVFRQPVKPGLRPYFLIRTQTGPGLRTATRVVPLEGVSNFRDLGGYPAADGRHVKWGAIFRSNALADLTPDDFRTVAGLGVQLVCDLRTQGERSNQPTRWPGTAPKVFTSSKAEMSGALTAMLGTGTPTPESARKGLIAFYRQAPDTYAEEYRAVFSRLLQGETPMIVHCTAGKDRTGVAAALILSALGTPRDVIIQDYALSAGLLRAGAERRARSPGYRANTAFASRLGPDVMAALNASDPEFIQAALDSAASEYGSVEAYLEQVLKIGPAERAALKARYLE